MTADTEDRAAPTAIIAVRGQAVREVAPELAVVGVAVTARDADRRDTLARLDDRRRAVAAVLDAHGPAMERIEDGGIRVQPQFKDGKPRERVVGYLASSSYRITVVDFAVLSELVAALLAQDLATVTGPWWSLRPDSPRYQEVRLSSVADARQRARDYAAALGSRITGLIELADVGLLSEQPAGFTRPMAAFAAPAPVGAAAPAPIEFDFTPEQQTVSAEVQVRFAASQPDR